jgi:hypothetical protein
MLNTMRSETTTSGLARLRVGRLSFAVPARQGYLGELCTQTSLWAILGLNQNKRPVRDSAARAHLGRPRRVSSCFADTCGA